MTTETINNLFTRLFRLEKIYNNELCCAAKYSFGKEDILKAAIKLEACWKIEKFLLTQFKKFNP